MGILMRPSELPKHKQDEIRAKQAGDPEFNLSGVTKIIVMIIFILAWFATLTALLFLS